MKFSTSRLYKMLCKAEPRVAKLTGYQVKFTEKSGRQLGKVFSKSPTLCNSRCSRDDCYVCKNSLSKGPTMCMVKSVVYEAVCASCDAEHRSGQSNQHRGRYVGQTSKTLYERSLKHIQGLNNHDTRGFAFKHWALVHPNPPQICVFCY